MAGDPGDLVVSLQPGRETTPRPSLGDRGPASAPDGTRGRSVQLPLKFASWITAGAILVAIGLGQIVLSREPSVATLYFVRDVRWLAATTILLIVLPLIPSLARSTKWSNLAVRHWRQLAIAVAATIVLVGVAGTYVVCRDFALSRDEDMAEFDAAILHEGKLIAPIAEEWRPFAAALEPEFRLPVPGDIAWVSTYLPGNAALRAFFSLLGGRTLTGPILAALALLALTGVARRLWPARPDAALVAVALLATSPQFLFMAMTPYAMTSHLALNLVWLWLYLRDDRRGHAAALAVGFLACGLHQIIFHPLFVAPFIVHLWASRRWQLAAFYTVGYALIGLFWISYWQFALAASGIEPAAAAAVGASHFVNRVAELLENWGWSSFDIMAKNLLRFIAWQNPLALPLALLAGSAMWHDRDVMRPLVSGIVLTMVAMLVLMPDQTQGWGYRYLHGLIGSFCLIAGQGWVTMSARATPIQRGAARSALVLAVAFSLFVVVPGRALEVNRLVSPFESASRAIQQSGVDVVIVNSTGLVFGVDLVRNDPFLRNTPKILSFEELDEPLIRLLCGRFRVAFFGAREGAAHGMATFGTEAEQNDRPELRALMRELSCGDKGPPGP